MRIFNATNSQLSLPFMGKQRITISPHSVSGDIMGSTDFLSTLVTAYDTSEVAIIVSGPYEINICATVPTAVNYVVPSLDEAIKRFNPVPEPEPEQEGEPVVNDEVPRSEEEKTGIAQDPTPKVEEKPVNEAIPADDVCVPSEPKPKTTKGKKSKGGKKK